MNVLLVGSSSLAHALRERIAQREGVTLVDDDSGIAPEVVVAAEVHGGSVCATLQRAAADYPVATLLGAALTMSASEIAATVKTSQFVGFALLPPLNHRVELMAAPQSSAAAMQRAEDFWRALDLEPVAIGDSVAGVMPRVVCTLINEAAYALQERVASEEDIDLAMQLGTNWPRGPLTWANLIGLEEVDRILRALQRIEGERYAPSRVVSGLARRLEGFHER